MTNPRESDAEKRDPLSLKKLFALPASTHAALILALAILTSAVGVSMWMRSQNAARPGPQLLREAALEKAKIDVNTASWIRLSELPGIGKVRSKAIVRWRAEHGPFRSVEDVLNVPEVPRKLAKSLKEHATASGPEHEAVGLSD